MSELFGVFAHDILPIFVGIALGFAFGLRFKPDAQVLARITLYIFSPSLVFSKLVGSSLEGGEVFRIAAFTILVGLIMGLLGWLAARALRLDAHSTAGLVLVVMFVNGGNYGLGVNERAFGADGLARAIVFFTTSTVMVYTIGMSVAAGSKGGGLRGALRNVFSIPPVYAIIAALLVRALAFDLDQSVLEPLAAGIDILGDAAIPSMLIILGIQLARTRVTENLRLVFAASGIRLVAGPIIAWGIAALIGLTGVARQASIVEASMPAAVINIILSTEYDTAPSLVTGTVLVSTLLSPLTLIPIISILK